MIKQDVNPPEVHEALCNGCERCVVVCPSFVLEMAEKKAKVFRGEWCIGCGHCGAVCPNRAIFQKGIVFESHPKGGKEPAVSPDVLELLLRERRSIRTYREEPVSREVLEKILDIGRYGPTGSNSQNVHYIVLTSQDQIEALRTMALRFYERVFSGVKHWPGRLLLSWLGGKRTVAYLLEILPKVAYFRKLTEEGKDRLFYHAPIVVLTHAESWDSSSSFNCSVALYHCSLKAHALGLGCCLNGFLVNAVNHDRRMKRWLGIPKDHRCFAAMVLGYPNVTYPNLVQREPPKVTWR